MCMIEAGAAAGAMVGITSGGIRFGRAFIKGIVDDVATIDARPPQGNGSGAADSWDARAICNRPHKLFLHDGTFEKQAVANVDARPPQGNGSAATGGWDTRATCNRPQKLFLHNGTCEKQTHKFLDGDMPNTNK